eukprot:scaffold4501_cov320-Pinguiococcus_pyrenoidosus.AAC.4
MPHWPPSRASRPHDKHVVLPADAEAAAAEVPSKAIGLRKALTAAADGLNMHIYTIHVARCGRRVHEKHQSPLRGHGGCNGKGRGATADHQDIDVSRCAGAPPAQQSYGKEVEPSDRHRVAERAFCGVVENRVKSSVQRPNSAVACSGRLNELVEEASSGCSLASSSAARSRTVMAALVQCIRAVRAVHHVGCAARQKGPANSQTCARRM